jgi:hypothetical protein
VTTPNAELAYKVLDHIDAHPESWDQGVWWCGSSGCYAGWTVALSGEAPTLDVDIPQRAAQLLGFEDREEMDRITDDAGEDNWLFYSENTREDLGRLVVEIFGPRPGGAS